MNPSPTPIRTRRAQAGFTFIELLVVIAILAIAALVGFPALQNMLIRSKLEGFAREFAINMQVARQEAIRQGVPVVVEFDQLRQEIFMFADVPDANGINNYVYDHDKATPLPAGTIPRTADYAIAPSQHGFTGGATGWQLPRGKSDETSIAFALPDGDSGENPGGFKKGPAGEDFTDEPRIVFLPDGSVAELGRVGVGDFRFPGDVDGGLCGNCFELAVVSKATAKVAVHKWNHERDAWFVHGRDKDNNEPLWVWY